MTKNSSGEKFSFFEEVRLELQFVLAFGAFDSELLAKQICHWVEQTVFEVSTYMHLIKLVQADWVISSWFINTGKFEKTAPWDTKECGS